MFHCNFLLKKMCPLEYKTLSNTNQFYPSYKKYCSTKGQIPLSVIRPRRNDFTVLDFYGDRIKYAEWEPILRALTNDRGLQFLAIRVRPGNAFILEDVDTESKVRLTTQRPVLLTRFLLLCTLESVQTCLKHTVNLSVLILEGIPLTLDYLEPVLKSLLPNRSLEQLGLRNCRIGDVGCDMVCRYMRDIPNIKVLDLCYCDIGNSGVSSISDLLKHQNISRNKEIWSQSLRYQKCDLDAQGGLRRITLNGNDFKDIGLKSLVDVLKDDRWLKALDMQDCGLTNVGAHYVLEIVDMNTSIDIVDIRCNSKVTKSLFKLIMNRLDRSASKQVGPYEWLNVVRPFSAVKVPTKPATTSSPPKPITYAPSQRPSTSVQSISKNPSKITKPLSCQVQHKISGIASEPVVNSVRSASAQNLIKKKTREIPTRYGFAAASTSTIILERSTTNAKALCNIDRKISTKETKVNNSQAKTTVNIFPVISNDEVGSVSKCFEKLSIKNTSVEKHSESQYCPSPSNSLGTQRELDQSVQLYYDALTNPSPTSSPNISNTTYYDALTNPSPTSSPNISNTTYSSETKTLTPAISASSTKTMIPSPMKSRQKPDGLKSTIKSSTSLLPRRNYVRPGTSKPSVSAPTQKPKVMSAGTTRNQVRNRPFKSSKKDVKASGDCVNRPEFKVDFTLDFGNETDSS